MTLARILAPAFIAGAACGIAAVLFLLPSVPRIDNLDALKTTFRRPATIPFPANNPYSQEKRELGERLFFDRSLSRDSSIACATCHNPLKGFADSRARSTGVSGHRLGRHTPTLWNLAFAAHVFWDGRARSLEQQVVNPIQATDEMAQSMDALVAKLAGDPAMARAFANAFPDDPVVSEKNIGKAIATFERTLISPPTRFDRWIGGDGMALSDEEIAGFRIFSGKAGCSNCHSGFAFTDYAFHDIGLPGDDRGRGAVLQLPAADHAFKTPTLREIGHSAPYMHDGSLATLEDVLDHYAHGIVARDTLSADLPRGGIVLSAEERSNLLAFLATLTSESASPMPATIVPGEAAPLPPAANVSVISQHEKTFSPAHVSIAPGGKLWFLNNDTRTHNIRVFHPDLDFDSGAQEPGETVEIDFPTAGSFLVFCGIHPKMELTVEVDESAQVR